MPSFEVYSYDDRQVVARTQTLREAMEMIRAAFPTVDFTNARRQEVTRDTMLDAMDLRAYYKNPLVSMRASVGRGEDNDVAEIRWSPESPTQQRSVGRERVAQQEQEFMQSRDRSNELDRGR